MDTPITSPKINNINEDLYAQALVAKLNLGLLDSHTNPSALEYLRNYGSGIDDFSSTTSQNKSLISEAIDIFKSPNESSRIQSLIDVNIKTIEDEDKFLYGESIIIEKPSLITSSECKHTSNLESSSWSDDDDALENVLDTKEKLPADCSPNCDASDNVLHTKEKLPAEYSPNCIETQDIKLKLSPLKENVQKPSAQIAPIMKFSMTKSILKLPSIPPKAFELPLPHSPKFTSKCTTKKDYFQNKNISDSIRILIKEEEKTPPPEIHFNDSTSPKNACPEEFNQEKNLNKKPLEMESNSKRCGQIKVSKKHSSYCKYKKKYYKRSPLKCRKHQTGKKSPISHSRSGSPNPYFYLSPIRRSREQSPMPKSSERSPRHRYRKSPKHRPGDRGPRRRSGDRSPRRRSGDRSPRRRSGDRSPRRRSGDRSPRQRSRERSSRRRSLVRSPDYIRKYPSGRNVFRRSHDRKDSPSPKRRSPCRRREKSRERSHKSRIRDRSDTYSPKRRSRSKPYRYRSKSPKYNDRSSASDSKSPRHSSRKTSRHSYDGSSDSSSESTSSRSTSSD